MARNDKRREPRFRDDDDDPDDGARDAPRERRRENAPSRRRRSRHSRSLLGAILYWSVTLGLWGGIGLAGALVYYGSKLPPIDQLAVPRRPPNIAILSADGALLANRGDTGGAAVRLVDLPPYLPKAFVSIEDRRFYSHWGLDPVGMVRAVVNNIIGRGGVQGGSTLTQQLAKNLFLTQERTLSRKFQEAILALWLEHKFSKDQILELYLNRVYFGSGAYGVEAAANHYFGHGARELSLTEAAVLAGLMKAPSKLAPDRNPDGASERAGQVITAMAQEGHISEAMAKAALALPAQARHDVGAGSINYVADYVMDVLAGAIGAIDEDIIVTTTIDQRLQMVAEGAIREELDKKGAKYGVTQGALVSIDPGGDIRALVGGRNYGESQFNRAVSAHRQPGSSFKPFVYLTALEHGLTPDSIRDDAPLNIKGWRPENYSREYQGPVTLTRALAMSLNTVAVRLGLEVGPKNVAKTAHRLGIKSDLQVNPSIALGTSEVTPLEIVTAYVPFANGGVGVNPRIIEKVTKASGEMLYESAPASTGRVVEPQYIAMMNAMMEETLATGTARKADLPGWQAAGKTGTSQDFRDAWFIGYTSRLVTGVWLGNDDNSPTKRASGSNLPVEIWSRYMTAAHRGEPVAGLPTGAWRSETAALQEAVRPLVRPLDDLIGILTGPTPPETPTARPKRPARVAAPVDQPREDPRVGATDPDQTPEPVRPTPRNAPARDAGEFVPPEDIPSVGAIPPDEPPPRREGARRERDFIDSLFGN
jgi:penicillin-binding protein 1A